MNGDAKRDTQRNMLVKTTVDDPALASLLFRHMRVLLDTPDIEQVEVDLRVHFAGLTDQQKARLRDLERAMWSIAVIEVERE